MLRCIMWYKSTMDKVLTECIALASKPKYLWFDLSLWQTFNQVYFAVLAAENSRKCIS